MHVSPVGGAAGDGWGGGEGQEGRCRPQGRLRCPCEVTRGFTNAWRVSSPRQCVAQRSAALFSVLPAAHMRSVALLCPALCDPWTVATRTVAIHGL